MKWKSFAWLLCLAAAPTNQSTAWLAWGAGVLSVIWEGPQTGSGLFYHRPSPPPLPLRAFLKGTALNFHPLPGGWRDDGGMEGWTLIHTFVSSFFSFFTETRENISRFQMVNDGASPMEVARRGTTQ